MKPTLERKNKPLEQSGPQPASEQREALEQSAPDTSSETKITTAPEQPTRLADFVNLRKKPKMPLPAVRDEVTAKIEKILEEGVGDAYSRLSPLAKQEFRLKGEQTAGKIRDLLKGTHVKVKKILQLILEWLRLLPGVNRFFLEQEAKIKTDRVIGLHKK